jgi:hypothetical protein
VVCQRQHWPSHKRQCRALADAELKAIVQRYPNLGVQTVMNAPDPSVVTLFLKISAITWTIRPRECHVHFVSLVSRAMILLDGRLAPGDTSETLTRLLKRACLELPWPELPGGTVELFNTHFAALIMIAQLGEPEAAVEILNRHVEDVEKRVVAPKDLAAFSIYRLNFLLGAAVKAKENEKKGDYVAEAKGVMERATRRLRYLQPQDFDSRVR